MRVTLHHVRGEIDVEAAEAAFDERLDKIRAQTALRRENARFIHLTKGQGS